MESRNFEENKNLVNMKKQIYLTSYVELSDLVDLNESDDDSEDEDKPKQKKPPIKRIMVKDHEQEKPSGNIMSDLIKNSLGNFFKKQVVDTKDPSL